MKRNVDLTENYDFGQPKKINNISFKKLIKSKLKITEPEKELFYTGNSVERGGKRMEMEFCTVAGGCDRCGSIIPWGRVGGLCQRCINEIDTSNRVNFINE